MKRLISVLLLLTLAFSMCACDMSMLQNILENLPLETTENQQPTPEETTPEDDGKIHITFYHNMGESGRAVLDKYIVEFNKLYPDIVIEHKQIGDYDQIQAEITSGDQPHIAYCYPYHVALYNTTYAVQTLDEYIASTEVVTRADSTTEVLGLTQEQIDNFIDGFYEEGRVYGDGKMYTLPMSKFTEVLYYNKTFFEQHNLILPSTWDEMEALCAAIKKIDPNCIPLGYDSEENWFITMCEQLDSPYTSTTGEHFLFDNETNRNFVAKFRDWYKKGYVTTQDIYGVYTSELFKGKDGVQSYMCIASSAHANYQIPKNDDGSFKFEVGVTTIPQVNPNSPKVIAQGPSLCIFKKSNDAEVQASWLFVKFLTTNLDFQAEFGMTYGYIPVLENITENAAYAEKLATANGCKNLSLLVAKVALKQANNYFTPPAFLGSDVVRNEVGYLLQKCISHEVDIQAEFQKAVEECKHQIGE